MAKCCQPVTFWKILQSHILTVWIQSYLSPTVTGVCSQILLCPLEWIGNVNLQRPCKDYKLMTSPKTEHRSHGQNCHLTLYVISSYVLKASVRSSKCKQQPLMLTLGRDVGWGNPPPHSKLFGYFHLPPPNTSQHFMQPPLIYNL